MEIITYDDFQKVELRTGKVLEAQDFPEAHQPAYKLLIDFGPDIGIKKSSAQIVANYSKEDLIGKNVVAVMNFSPKQIGPFVSQVLTCGADDRDGNVVLLSFDKSVSPGQRIY